MGSVIIAVILLMALTAVVSFAVECDGIKYLWIVPLSVVACVWGCHLIACIFIDAWRFLSAR